MCNDCYGFSALRNHPHDHLPTQPSRPTIYYTRPIYGGGGKLKGATMNEDTYKGFMTGKMLTGRYVVCIDDFQGNREEFIHGLRMAGYRGEVRFAS